MEHIFQKGEFLDVGLLVLLEKNEKGRLLKVNLRERLQEESGEDNFDLKELLSDLQKETALGGGSGIFSDYINEYRNNHPHDQAGISRLQQEQDTHRP